MPRNMLGGALSAYISWLARHSGRAAYEQIDAHLDRWRAMPRFARHPRTVDNIANLSMGVRTFLRFAAESGAIDPQARDPIGDDLDEALIEAARAHDEVAPS